MLEWFRDSRRYTYRLAVLAIAVMAGIGSVISGGVSWITDWVYWVILLLLASAMLLGRRHWMAAGADWFAAHTGWVRTYELTKIELTGNAASPRLYLTDANGNRVHAELRRMQANPRLWDLVYNGIQHSVHTHDPTINKAARAQVVEYHPRHRAGPDQVG